MPSEPLQIKPGLMIPGPELEESFSHSGGSGGQHVNKVATKATLRIDGKELETKSVLAKRPTVTFVTKLTKGLHQLSPYFHIPAGQLGAYYTVVTTTSP